MRFELSTEDRFYTPIWQIMQNRSRSLSVNSDVSRHWARYYKSSKDTTNSTKVTSKEDTTRMGVFFLKKKSVSIRIDRYVFNHHRSKQEAVAHR